MEDAPAKASPTQSKPPTLASPTPSIHSDKQPNGQPPATPPHDAEDDPRTQLIETLRAQLTDTHTQLTQLNSKLVQSYDRVSHLEDTLEETSTALNTTKARVSQLEAAQSAHEAALETGVLVEREHVAHELSRLMERATEEAAQRGVADAARSRIETELDDLSADLFGRANTMVAEARIARAASEQRVVEAQDALKGAEEAVKGMQLQMQQMAEARRQAENQVAEIRARMGKGKWVDRGGGIEMEEHKRRLFNNHVVYREFNALISHLRGLRASSGVVPQMSALISLPFIARLIMEDCDPTLRLDLAPALNWLTRRAVHTAILQGQLEIEPVYGLLEAECALCGLHPHGHPTPIGSAATSPTAATHTLPTRPQLNTGAMAAWASTTSKYLKGSLASPTTSPQTAISSITTPPLHRTSIDPNTPPVYVFRIANAQANVGSPLVLCSGGWCLARLRTTCELCSFLRQGVVEKVWSEPPQNSITPSVSATSYTQGGVLGSVVSVLGRDKEATTPKDKEVGEAPPVPPRRRQLSQLSSSIWEKGLGAFGSRSGSRSGTPTQEEPKEEPPKVERRLPPPPAPNDTKLSIVPPPPPPRARPVPPVPGAAEAKETHDATPVPHEEIPHAMVFDAADHEHGHHAMSPTTDKRHSVPPISSLSAHPSTFPDSPKPAAESLPAVAENPTAPEPPQAVPEPASEAPTTTAESEPSVAPVPAPVSEPAPTSEPTPAPEPTAAPETPSRPPAISRPVRARLLPPDGDKPPTSPGGVALPESRSSSPAPGARPASPSPRPMTPPNRISSPAPGSPTPGLRRGGSIRAESPVPGSPADGGPPKIPRRAPRRAAPVPPPVAPVPSAGPDPFTHTEKAEEKPAEHGDSEKKPDEGEPKPVEGDKPKVEEHHVVRPPRRAIPPPPALPARARSPKPAEEVHPAEVKPAEITENVEETKPVEEVKPIEPEEAPEDKPVETTAGPAPQTTASEKALDTAPVVSTTDDKPVPAESQTVSAPTNEKTSDAEKTTADPIDKPAVEDGQFVGEQSWEERAYKEIVKLREDMFWARIGSAW